MTKTTVGALVANLFAMFERHYHDEKLAAVATQMTFDELRVRRHREAMPRVAVRPRRKAV